MNKDYDVLKMLEKIAITNISQLSIKWYINSTSLMKAILENDEKREESLDKWREEEMLLVSPKNKLFPADCYLSVFPYGKNESYILVLSVKRYNVEEVAEQKDRDEADFETTDWVPIPFPKRDEICVEEADGRIVYDKKILEETIKIESMKLINQILIENYLEIYQPQHYE